MVAGFDPLAVIIAGLHKFTGYTVQAGMDTDVLAPASFPLVIADLVTGGALDGRRGIARQVTLNLNVIARTQTEAYDAAEKTMDRLEDWYLGGDAVNGGWVSSFKEIQTPRLVALDQPGPARFGQVFAQAELVISTIPAS